MNIQTRRPTRVALSAYIDGKSHSIESMKLDAVDRLETAQDSSDGQLKVLLDGQRHSLKGDLVRFTALGLAPTAAAAALGAKLAGTVGGVVGAVAGLAVFGMPATHFLGRSLKARQWTSESRLPLGGEAKPSPVKEAGAERLRSLVDESRAKNPQARQVLFLSGHGNIDEVAQMPWSDLNKTMKGSDLDATILDACLTSQLEVAAQLAPWAGLVMASPHKIKARGLELPRILASKHLEKESFQDAVTDMAREARSTTPSWVVLDTARLQKQFLPKLDSLGKSLCKELKAGKRSQIRAVLKESLSSEGLFSAKVDLGSFLSNLEESGLAPEEAKQASQGFRECVPFQKNQHTMSFHLQKGQDEQSLPQGWREFLSELDYRFKPLF